MCCFRGLVLRVFLHQAECQPNFKSQHSAGESKLCYVQPLSLYGIYPGVSLPLSACELLKDRQCGPLSLQLLAQCLAQSIAQYTLTHDCTGSTLCLKASHGLCFVPWKIKESVGLHDLRGHLLFLRISEKGAVCGLAFRGSCARAIIYSNRDRGIENVY